MYTIVAFQMQSHSLHQLFVGGRRGWFRINDTENNQLGKSMHQMSAGHRMSNCLNQQLISKAPTEYSRFDLVGPVGSREHNKLQNKWNFVNS